MSLFGLFGGSDNPDSRLLNLDDKFTSAAKYKDSDSGRARSVFQQVLNSLRGISGLSTKDEEYRKRLISSVEHSLKNLR